MLDIFQIVHSQEYKLILDLECTLDICLAVRNVSNISKKSMLFHFVKPPNVILLVIKNVSPSVIANIFTTLLNYSLVDMKCLISF